MDDAYAGMKTRLEPVKSLAGVLLKGSINDSKEPCFVGLVSVRAIGWNVLHACKRR